MYSLFYEKKNTIYRKKCETHTSSDYFSNLTSFINGRVGLLLAFIANGKLCIKIVKPVKITVQVNSTKSYNYTHLSTEEYL